ncbi:haloacid dehalogenase-like hydrolase [Candidatus Saccharibacteria bacterium]|nr:haloacid dehalogenase-like hydrolase [Candidatus Saccharibacteria bacterium]
MIAIFDFDGTLTPVPVPQFGILEKCGMREGFNCPEFRERALKKVEEMGLYGAIWAAFFETVKGAGFRATEENLCLGYEKVKYHDGVDEFLRALKEAGMHNYLVSGGMKYFLDKISVAPLFEGIYGTTFEFDENGEADKAARIIGDKEKAEVIREILELEGKDAEDCKEVVYFGDGHTDYYAMEYVKRHGGETVFIYRDDSKKYLDELKEEGLVSAYFKPDYLPNGEIRRYLMETFGVVL